LLANTCYFWRFQSRYATKK